MKKGFRDFVCLLALAVLLLALPAGSLADDEWSANWTSSTSSITYGGTITNGSAVLTAEYYYQTYTIFIEGVHADSGPLGDLVLPTEIDGCTSFIVSTRVFAGNDTLTSITATPSVTSIQPYAFQNCTNLIRADLSACKLTNVRNEIFRGCTSLETVILPSTITEIEAQAFKDCTSLNTVYILSETPPEISTDSFANCSSDLRIVSVNADVDEYPNVPGWSAYADKIVGASLLTASPASHAWTVQRHGTANAQTFTLTNEDGHNAEAIASLSVALAGANADAFTLSTDGMSASLNVGGSTRFTVTPKTDLSTGTYLEASKTVNLAVAEKGAVALTLTPSASAVTYGDAVTLTADVSKADSSDPDALTGDVRFYLDSVDATHQLGEPQDVTGELSVTLDRAELTAGTHTVYAVYEGNSAFADRQTQIDIMVAARTLGGDASELSASRSQAQAGEAEVHGTLRLTGRLDGDAVTLIPDTGLVTSGLAGVAQPGEYQVKVVPQSGAYALNNPNYALPDDGPVITAFVYASTEEDVPSTGSDRLKLVMEAGLSSVPASLAGTYASPAQLEAALRADVTALGVPGADVAIYDVTLMVSRDGGQSWSEVTESDFPASGITVTLPYPAGTGTQGYVFTVAHMFSSGANAGRIEHPTATATEKGVSFTVTGLSPVALGWTAGNYAVTLHPSGGTIAAGKDVTGYTYGVGAALPTAADVTRDGYTFDGWYDNAALTGSPVTVITTADVGNREYWAKWLSAGVGLKPVSVDGTAGVIDGTEISVVLPAGSSLPTDAQQIAVTPADAQASVSMPVTADGGATWTFTVTAQDGTSRAYTLRITLAVALPQTGDASYYRMKLSAASGLFEPLGPGRR